MLDAHSRLAIPYESHFFVRYFKDRQSQGDLAGDRDSRSRLVRQILKEPYVLRWDRQISPDEVDLDSCDSLENTINQIYLAYARRFGKDLWGDKTPAYVADIHVLHQMFPRARFVHIIRDGRDVALSIIKQWWGANDFMSAIDYWAQTLRCAQKMLAMLPANQHISLRFEDLVRDPETELKRVCCFLDLDYEPQMLEGYAARAGAKVGERIKRHHNHLTQRPTSSQALKWQQDLSRADQAVAYEIAGPLLAELGYPTGTQSHPLKIVRKCWHRLREAYCWRFGGPPHPDQENALPPPVQGETSRRFFGLLPGTFIP
jgi:hypothetical protein